MCVFSSLLDVYLQPSVWSPASTLTSTLTSTATSLISPAMSAVHERSPARVVEHLNSDGLQVCLLLEGVNVFAQVGVICNYGGGGAVRGC